MDFKLTHMPDKKFMTKVNLIHKNYQCEPDFGGKTMQQKKKWPISSSV